MNLIVITGPTATGKTLLGVRLAQTLNGEVVSADSMQVYKELNIGTAKPTVAETDGVVHHMTDVVSACDDYSVACYVRQASACVEDIISRGRQPIVVGGSGLYVDSLIRGREFTPRGNPALRKQLEDHFDKLGGEAMLEELRTLDKDSAEILNANDKKRIVRALEVVMTTGLPVSEYNSAEKRLPNKYNADKFALTYSERHVLYDRINKRVDAMISSGLVEEVKSLLNSGVPRTCTAMQAIGYKEIVDALSSGTDISEAVELIKMSSRRYAKRQLTWLRRDETVKWITFEKAPDVDIAVQFISESIKKEPK